MNYAIDIKALAARVISREYLDPYSQTLALVAIAERLEALVVSVERVSAVIRNDPKRA